MAGTGKWLMILGSALLVVGAIVFFAGKVPWFGKLPGDIVWRKGHFTLFVPLATTLRASILLTIIVKLVAR